MRQHHNKTMDNGIPWREVRQKISLTPSLTASYTLITARAFYDKQFCRHRYSELTGSTAQCSNFYLDVEKKLADFGSHFSITWYRYMLVWKYFSNLDDKCLKKTKFSNLVHTKVLKISRFFNFSPFGPTWANFHLLYVALLEVENFLAFSKCLQQAAVKIQKSGQIRTPEAHKMIDFSKKQFWPDSGSN